MLFSVLPKNDEDAADSNAVKNSKFFSVCVPVNVKDSPFIF